MPQRPRGESRTIEIELEETLAEAILAAAVDHQRSAPEEILALIREGLTRREEKRRENELAARVAKGCDDDF